MNSNKRPRVTILIPCFEASAYVGEAIQCALDQTYGHVEVVVSPDDGDTYIHLRETFKSPQLRIIAPSSTSGTGPGATRNRAIDASSGDYFTVLDADDLIPANYVEELMRVAMVEGAAVAPTRYVAWDSLDLVRAPPVPNKVLSLTGYSQLLSSIHPLVHRSLETGYPDGFAEDVVHDGTIIAKLGTITVVPSVAYSVRLRSGSACSSGADAELGIQRSYTKRIEQIRRSPTQLHLQSLSANDRRDFEELFRFRAMVSMLFSASGATCYNTWVAGNEARLWDQFMCSVIGASTYA